MGTSAAKAANVTAAKASTVTSSKTPSKAAAAASQRFVVGEHQTPENQRKSEYCLFPHDILSRHNCGPSRPGRCTGDQ